jgi:MerR family transcriptional regulator, light-induced transcriptional regulator
VLTVAAVDSKIPIKRLVSLQDDIFKVDFAREPGIGEIRDKYLADTAYTLRFLSIAQDIGEPVIFSQYMRWFGSLASHLGFRIASMSRHFDVIREVIKAHGLDHELPGLLDTFDSGTDAFENAYMTPLTYDPSDNRFLELLLDMRSDEAYMFVSKKIEGGMTLRNVYLTVFQPTLYTVGELWHQGKISVAKEHYVTAAIQHIIGKLYPILFSNTERTKHTVTAVCAGDELHEIGMRMVADFFEMAGWDTVFLGSNLPVEMVISHLEERPTDLLAVSATTSSNLLDLKELISKVKSHPTLHDRKIMVGGKIFNDTPDLWRRLKADAYAADAEQAVLLARLIVGETHA